MPRAHAGQHRLGAQEHRFQVHRQRQVELRLGEVVDAADDGDPGIVDQHVDRPEIGFDPMHHGGHRIAEGDIGAHHDRPPATRADRRRDPIGLGFTVAAVHRDVGSGGGQRQRDGPSDAARCPCDQSDTASQIRCQVHDLIPRIH
ncbi:MAG: hypothetical protein WDN25_14275 [Acetobacteraceae bacterium]